MSDHSTFLHSSVAAQYSYGASPQSRSITELSNPVYFYLCDEHPKPASNDSGEQRVHEKGVSNSYPQKCFPILRVLIPNCGMKISSVFLGTSAALLYYWIV